MKIVELQIDESSLSGFDATALVENPAIEQDFIAFNKVKMADLTHNDYPQAAVDAAKRGIQLNEENNMKCATQVGKVRAQQLVNGEKLSLDTIQRMRSFLIRQKGNYELATRRKDYTACGYISYLLWGGEAALPWAEKKLRQAGLEFSRFADEGKDVYLVSCSSEKLDKPAIASELYDSALFKKSLDFARKQQTNDDYIKILSAKYHLTDLDQMIEPYDLTLKNFSSQQRKDWANKVYSQILDKYSLQYDRFMFLAGNAYTEYLMSKFKYKTDVLEGMRIGERMAYLDKFYIVTNNDNYATKHNFTLVDPEATILEEILKQEFSLYNNISFDYDGVLTTAAGKELARQEIAKGNKVYIISARENKEGMLDIANELGIPDQNVYAAKNNVQKLEQIETLNIDMHYDDNPDVIGKLGNIGHNFSIYNNEGLLEEYAGLEDACQSGYVAIGLKTKNGRKVPNCVPKDSFEINVAALPNFINEASSGLKHKYFEEAILPSILELKKNKFASQLAEKQMLIGPLMTPNKLIPRVDEITGEEYEVFFSADTIEKIAYKMMADKLLDKVNIEHNGDEPVKDVHLVETWLVKDPEHDKSSLYGFKPVQGQWFGIYRIGDGRVWNEYVKTGKVKGFSVEGYFYNNILTNK